MSKRRDTYSDFDGLTSEDVDKYLGPGTASGSNLTAMLDWEADMAKHHKGVRTNKKAKGGGKYTSVANLVPKCRHFHKAFELPNGLVVQGSSYAYEAEKPSERRTPDFGLYCDHIWAHVNWRAEFVNFPDYRAPAAFDTAAEAIVEAYGRAADGWSVEAGCIGGHGRTGTVLACWVVLASGWNPQDAMKYVWEHYCKEAIESKAQVEFIDWFAEYVEVFGLTGENNNG